MRKMLNLVNMAVVNKVNMSIMVNIENCSKIRKILLNFGIFLSYSFEKNCRLGSFNSDIRVFAPKTRKFIQGLVVK